MTTQSEMAALLSRSTGIHRRRVDRPETILSLLEARGAEEFFAGLLKEYAHCAASGRLDLWEECAHSIVTLLASTTRARLAEKEETR